MRTFGHNARSATSRGKCRNHPSPVCAITRAELGGQFGRDRKRRVIFTLEAADVVAMRPAGTTRTLRVQARDVYRWALQAAASISPAKCGNTRRPCPQNRAPTRAKGTRFMTEKIQVTKDTRDTMRQRGYSFGGSTSDETMLAEIRHDYSPPAAKTWLSRAAGVTFFTG